jgi:ketopantoate reductase
MRVLILGATVIGSFNAARLTEAGQDIYNALSHRSQAVRHRF